MEWHGIERLANNRRINVRLLLHNNGAWAITCAMPLNDTLKAGERTHTSGPWTYANGIIVGDGKIIADYGCSMERNHEAEPNARLMTAAPELLAALILALQDHDFEGIELNHDTVTAARAAIAKATGGAQ